MFRYLRGFNLEYVPCGFIVVHAWRTGGDIGRSLRKDKDQARASLLSCVASIPAA
jgi:hypothetical protein